MPKKAKSTAPRPATAVPTKVQEDDEFRPLAVYLGGKRLAVESIDERMEEEDEWWEQTACDQDALPGHAGGRANGYDLQEQ